MEVAPDWPKSWTAMVSFHADGGCKFSSPSSTTIRPPRRQFVPSAGEDLPSLDIHGDALRALLLGERGRRELADERPTMTAGRG
jgi:hypothetical protein